MIRVGVISPEPTPYRAPMFDRLALEAEIDLTVIYCADTVAAREWNVELKHRHTVLSGPQLPTRRFIAHDYPISPRLPALLRQEGFDCLVIAGWSLFAAQAAIAWARVHGVPYITMSESHLLDPRPGWIRAVKRLAIPAAVRPAAGHLVTGTLAGECIAGYGGRPDRIGIFANTVDTLRLAGRAGWLRARRAEHRARLGIEPDDVAVLHCGRLETVKGTDVLVDALARARGEGASALRLVCVGSGTLQEDLQSRADASGLPISFAGFLAGDDLTAAYAAADVFSLLSVSEPWGVVVNEAAACGLPLVLSDRVGAGPDLVEEGSNGTIVPVGDVGAAARAFARLAANAELREEQGARSRERSLAWGYERSIDDFVTAVRRAVGRAPA